LRRVTLSANPPYGRIARLVFISSAMRCLVIFFFFISLASWCGDHRLDRRGGDLLADTLLVEPAFEAGAYVRAFSRHTELRSSYRHCRLDPAIHAALPLFAYLPHHFRFLRASMDARVKPAHDEFRKSGVRATITPKHCREEFAACPPTASIGSP